MCLQELALLDEDIGLLHHLGDTKDVVDVAGSDPQLWMCEVTVQRTKVTVTTEVMCPYMTSHCLHCVRVIAQL